MTAAQFRPPPPPPPEKTDVLPRGNSRNHDHVGFGGAGLPNSECDCVPLALPNSVREMFSWIEGGWPPSIY